MEIEGVQLKRLVFAIKSAIFFAIVPSLAAAEFHVSPDGSSAGNGSLTQPWDLQTALDHPTNVVPGDTIWLRGGVHRIAGHITKFVSSLRGTLSQPIIVRQYPGERAIIDGNISQPLGGWVNYWGFEIMNSHSNRLTTEAGSFPARFREVYAGQTNDVSGSGFDLQAPGVKLINLIIHDSIGNGVFTSGMNAEVYGCVCYYNGWQGCDRGHGHGLYGQSEAPNTAKIQECLFFANYGIGTQATATRPVVDNFYFEGNVFFFNGILAREHQVNFLIGAYMGFAKNPVIIRNFVYDTNGTESDSNIGYAGGTTDAVVRSNYFQTSVYFSPRTRNLTLTDNTFLSNTLNLVQSNFPNNLYLTNRPQTNLIEIRTNKYEPGRAHIIVYNWENLTDIAVDAGNILPVGVAFEVHNVQDYFGPPVLSGTYDGSPLPLPMTSLKVAKPVGTNAPASTAPEFNVFILTPYVGDETGTNSAPTISYIEDQFTLANVPTAPIPFTIFDAETPAEYLTLSVSSSDPTLLPHSRIFFGGSGSDRTVTLFPLTNHFGITVVTLSVSDGLLTASTAFILFVGPNFDAIDLSYPVPFSHEINHLDDGVAFLTLQSNRSVLLQLGGEPGVAYDVQASTDLMSWNSLGITTVDCNGIANFLDTGATNYLERYYRFRLGD